MYDSRSPARGPGGLDSDMPRGRNGPAGLASRKRGSKSRRAHLVRHATRAPPATPAEARPTDVPRTLPCLRGIPIVREEVRRRADGEGGFGPPRPEGPPRRDAGRPREAGGHLRPLRAASRLTLNKVNLTARPYTPRRPRSPEIKYSAGHRAAVKDLSVPEVRGRLLQWFDDHRRDLPWRRTRDPYRILVAEVLLQRTRVVSGTPYYERFLERFPTVRDLAAASLESVLGAWEGLGFYGRARNLHAAAKAIVERHGGDVPRDLEALEALPGVGPYTAGAVGSIAFGIPAAAVDGNVTRVLSRLV